MDFISSMRFVPQKAVAQDDSSFTISLKFDNVIGAQQAVEAINATVDTIKCPNGFNGMQLAFATANLASTVYSAIKKAKSN